MRSRCWHGWVRVLSGLETSHCILTWQKGRGFFPGSLLEGNRPSRGLHVHDLNIPQRPHLLKPSSLQGLGFQHVDFGRGCKHLDDTLT